MRKADRGPGVFPDTLPAQLAELLAGVGGDDWKLQECRFVDGDPTRLEVIFTGVVGGRLRLTVSARKLGQGFFTYAFADDPGNPAFTPIANGLSWRVQETVETKQPDVILDMDLISMGRSKF